MFEGNKVLVVGMARSGISSAKFLLKNGASLIINDSKTEEELREIISDIEQYGKVKKILGRNPNKEEIVGVDFAVLSPGVPLDLEYVIELKKLSKPVISEIELAYEASREKQIKFVGITGTNGKTTTTSIMGEICKAAELETYIVGNIGYPAIEQVEKAGLGSVFVTELSSFQLESVLGFKPYVSSVLNLTEDHMNRHHTMENYAKAKARIFENQDENDTCVLNYDDEYTRNMAAASKAKTIFFSRLEKPENGIFLDNDSIVVDSNGEIETIMKVDELSLPGVHNLENCMAAIAMSIALEIDKEIIVDVLKNFKAVEHRLEFVKNVNNVKYVNDSKGTNPDSTIKAVQSYKEPIILIAGGYDKGSDFNELFEIANKNVRTIITLGQTSELIGKTAKCHGIDEIIEVDSIKQAVEKSSEIANEGDIVLLSPACASWGMYNNYEERGNDFKECVNSLKSNNK